jgi:hypothetical protein
VKMWVANVLPQSPHSLHMLAASGWLGDDVRLAWSPTSCPRDLVTFTAWSAIQYERMT